MAATVPTRAYFLARFPEFVGVEDAFLDTVLADAAETVNPDVFQSSTREQRAVCLHAAINLCRSPKGRKMRNEDPAQVYQWEFELNRLNASATVGLRVFVALLVGTWGVLQSVGVV